MGYGHHVVLSLETGNAAFHEGDSDITEGREVARILRAAADRVEEQGIGEGQAFTLMDANGQGVGFFRTTCL